MSKNRHYKAYESMSRVRFEKVQAARDVFYMHTLLEAEEEIKDKRKTIILELVTVPRNRRAMMASEIVMFMQQVSDALCSLPVLADEDIVLRCECHSVL